MKPDAALNREKNKTKQHNITVHQWIKGEFNMNLKL